jgi:alkylated DNA nucleotide flippase Atl1
MNATAQAILDALNREKIRATYGAVAEVLHIPARSVGQVLGTRRPEASWVVRDDDGMPAEYEAHQLHAELTRRSVIIRSGEQLRLLLRGAPLPTCTCAEMPGLCKLHPK